MCFRGLNLRFGEDVNICQKGDPISKKLILQRKQIGLTASIRDQSARIHLHNEGYNIVLGHFEDATAHNIPEHSVFGALYELFGLRNQTSPTPIFHQIKHRCLKLMVGHCTSGRNGRGRRRRIVSVRVH